MPNMCVSAARLLMSMSVNECTDQAQVGDTALFLRVMLRALLTAGDRLTPLVVLCAFCTISNVTSATVPC